ncbi:hypothetical protein LIER_16783 [Lithospermum erythrorhizon]|uniref:Uncharacterized protein n=1 Tax=Lithospermum erythrorhizon TaxID=34254 RepID=A0AAV3QDD1_LITER
MDFAHQGARLLGEDKIPTNHITFTILRKAKVKVPKDFKRSKQEPEMKWGDYPSDSDHKDIEESCHMYVEVEDILETEAALEAPQTTQEVPRAS